MSSWLEKRYREVIRKWRVDQISMADAAAELVWLGIPADQAWKILAEA